MSNINDNRIIAPPIEDEVYPYRRVWRSIITQMSLLIILSITMILLQAILNIADLQSILPRIVVVLPLILWLVFSILPEQSVVSPRLYLVRVAVISSLTAFAIGLPLAHEFFLITDWLPSQSVIQRVVGYTVTVGVIDTALRFLVIRYLVYPDQFRIRTDPLAYCVASAIGYSTAISIDGILVDQPILIIGVINTLANYVTYMASGFILSYGLAQSVFSRAFVLTLPFAIVISSLIVGFIAALQSPLTAGSLSTAGSFARPLFSMIFLIAVLFLTLFVIFFLYAVAERRSREMYIN